MQIDPLLSEMGLDKILEPHKSFLLALIKCQKVHKDNLFKILTEFKTKGHEFDNECIYCKYSSYAIRESL